MLQAAVFGASDRSLQQDVQQEREFEKQRERREVSFARQPVKLDLTKLHWRLSDLHLGQMQVRSSVMERFLLRGSLSRRSASRNSSWDWHMYTWGRLHGALLHTDAAGSRCLLFMTNTC